MNQITEKQKIFPFDVEVIFKIYNDVSRLWSLPTPELIIDIYDDKVQDRLTELHDGLTSPGSSMVKEYPWKHLHTLPIETIQNLNELIDMKTILETKELVQVLDYYNMFYLDHYGNYRNMPVKDVW